MARPKFSAPEMAEMVALFHRYGSARRAAIAYGELHQPVGYRIILRAVRRFRNRGSVGAAPRRRPALRPARTFDRELDILLFVHENPHSSTRAISRTFGTSKSTVHRILRTYDLRAFRGHVVHGMYEGDPVQRLNFLAHMEILRDAQEDFSSHILWTDESTFTNNGVFNRWNFRTWAEENPHITYQSRHQVRYTANVWCGLVGNHLIGPYFIEEGALNGERYLNFLRNELPALMEDVPLAVRSRMWFQHDGCPAHRAQRVTQYLNRKFPGRWIGHQGVVNWPPRSPDLTPLDFFLWGYLKNQVYAARLPPILSNEEIRRRIVDACRSLTPQSIREAVTREWIRRAELCLMEGGGHVEHRM